MQVDSQISFVSRRALVDWLVVHPNLHTGREVESVSEKPPECPTSGGAVPSYPCGCVVLHMCLNIQGCHVAGTKDATLTGHSPKSFGSKGAH